MYVRVTYRQLISDNGGYMGVHPSKADPAAEFFWLDQKCGSNTANWEKYGWLTAVLRLKFGSVVFKTVYSVLLFISIIGLAYN
jgi:hypothetical protein